MNEYTLDYDPFSDEDLERVLEEIIDSVEVVIAGEGPEGPWLYKSLTVRRVMNEIHVRGPDGRRVATIEVPDFSETSVDATKWLKKRLDEINEDQLSQL